MLQYPLFARAYDLGLQQLPILIFAVTFTLLYLFLPNTKVKFTGALLGGLFSAVAVQAAFTTYVGFSVGVARAEALYGVFAQLPLLFVWIYTVWAIVLLGAEIAFAYQNLSSYRREVRSRDVSSAEREALALHLCVSVAQRFREGATPLDTQTASDLLDAPVRVVREVEAQLTRRGILSRLIMAADLEGLAPGRPPEQIQVADVLAAMRGERDLRGRERSIDRLVEGVLSELDEGMEKGVGGRTLADLLDAAPTTTDTEPAANPR